MNNKKLTNLKVIYTVVQSLIMASLGASVGLTAYDLFSIILPYSITWYDFVFSTITIILLIIQFPLSKKISSLKKLDK